MLSDLIERDNHFTKTLLPRPFVVLFPNFEFTPRLHNITILPSIIAQHMDLLCAQYMAVLYTTTFWLNPETYSWSENQVNGNTREVCKRGALNLKPANTSTRVNGYIYKIFIGNLGAYSRSAGEASHKQRSEVRLTNGNPCLWFDWVDRINTDQLILRIQVEGSSIFYEMSEASFKTGDQYLTSN